MPKVPKRRPERHPQRTCAVCRTVRTKQEMTRIVRTEDGRAALDLTGRVPGRGTYVCADPSCRAAEGRAAAIARALGLPGGAAAVSDEVMSGKATRAAS